MRPRSSMMTTASKVASISASTSGVGPDILSKHTCLRGLLGARRRNSPASYPSGRMRRALLQQAGVDFRFGQQPVFGVVAGSETALLGAEIRGFRDQRGSLLMRYEVGNGGFGLLRGSFFPGRALGCGCQIFLTRHSVSLGVWRRAIMRIDEVMSSPFYSL